LEVVYRTNRMAKKVSIFLADYLAPAAVAVTAIVLAGVVYLQFLEHHRHLWTSLIHDRNAHYWLGLNFALDFRHGDLGHLLSDLDRARVWRPHCTP